MLEYPEVMVISQQLEEALIGKEVISVLPPTKVHKFCWFEGDPKAYEEKMKHASIVAVRGAGIYVMIQLDNGYEICFNDGVNVRLYTVYQELKNYQLLIQFQDGMMLGFTVAMYGSIILHNGDYDNLYYQKSKNALPYDHDDFPAYFQQQLQNCKQTMSLKGLLATEQRFPGLGNGCLQEILYEAKLHPKRKINSLRESEKTWLQQCIMTVMAAMLKAKGRYTEKDIYGQKGGYQTKMSKYTIASPCPICQHSIMKETYLGGAIYYCPCCQPLIKI